MAEAPLTSSRFKGLEVPMPTLPIKPVVALRMTALPVVAPIVKAVAAPPMLRLVAVVFRRLKFVAVVVISPPLTATSLAVVMSPADVIDQSASVKAKLSKALPMAMVSAAVLLVPILMVLPTVLVPMAMVSAALLVVPMFRAVTPVPPKLRVATLAPPIE